VNGGGEGRANPTEEKKEREKKKEPGLERFRFKQKRKTRFEGQQPKALTTKTQVKGGEKSACKLGILKSKSTI